MSQSDCSWHAERVSLDEMLCEPGASAFHVNSGERWTVVHNLGGYLIVRSPRDTERKISIESWLGEAWADR